MRIHLITAESPESRRVRRGRLIQIPQLTMPLIAALTPREHNITHTDEIVEPVRFDEPADVVGITAPTCGYRKLSPSWKRENLVCMPTLSAGETDRGNHSVAIQRCSESQVQRTIRCQLATRLLWFIRRTEAIVAEDRLTKCRNSCVVVEKVRREKR